jgi:hypothetical protein
MFKRTQHKLFILVAFFAALGAMLTINAQEKKYTSAEGDYTLTLPSSSWRVISQGDGTRQVTEIVNNERREGLLRIRKEVIEPNTTVEEVARRDLDQKLPYLPGFVAGGQEKFNGRLSGVVASYEYTNAGKPMLGLIYYLQADPRTIYTLHFTGLRNRLSLIRNQTDAIARSFQTK